MLWSKTKINMCGENVVLYINERSCVWTDFILMLQKFITCFGINIVYHLQANTFHELSQVQCIQLYLNLMVVKYKNGTRNEVELCAESILVQYYRLRHVCLSRRKYFCCRRGPHFYQTQKTISGFQSKNVIVIRYDNKTNKFT